MKNAKATVCVRNTCVTVFGTAAKVLTVFAVIGAAAVVVDTVSKALKA
jgi:uncharacterized membrane protein